MTKEKMREEFEQWATSKHYGVERYQNNFGKHYKNGDYVGTVVNYLWEAWQASRENIELELPEKCPELPIYNMALDDVKQKLTEQGFKVK